jgi:hypothetical protein
MLVITCGKRVIAIEVALPHWLLCCSPRIH